LKLHIQPIIFLFTLLRYTYWATHARHACHHSSPFLFQLDNMYEDQHDNHQK